MKKYILLVFLFCVIALNACDMFSSEFNNAVSNFMDLTSVKIDMVTTIFDMDIDSEIIVDGDYSKATIEDEVTYNYISDGLYYALEEFGDNYMAYEVEYEDTMGFTTTDLLDEAYTWYEDDFELIDGYYVYQLDSDEFTEYKIKIEEDVIIELYILSEDSGFSVELTLTFSEYNMVSVDLPDNIIDDQTYQSALDSLSSANIDFGYYDQVAEFVVGETSITCDFSREDGMCDIEENYTSWSFSRYGDNFNYQDEAYTSLDDLYTNAEMSISKTDFELIIEVIANLFN